MFSKCMRQALHTLSYNHFFAKDLYERIYHKAHDKVYFDRFTFEEPAITTKDLLHVLEDAWEMSSRELKSPHIKKAYQKKFGHYFRTYIFPPYAPLRCQALGQPIPPSLAHKVITPLACKASARQHVLWVSKEALKQLSTLLHQINDPEKKTAFDREVKQRLLERRNLLSNKHKRKAPYTPQPPKRKPFRR